MCVLAAKGFAADIDELKTLAMHQAQDPALRSFVQNTLQQSLAQRAISVAQECKTLNGAKEALDLVLSLDAAGDVSVTASSTESAFADCVSQALDGSNLPAPPSTPFLTLISFSQ